SSLCERTLPCEVIDADRQVNAVSELVSAAIVAISTSLQSRRGCKSPQLLVVGFGKLLAEQQLEGRVLVLIEILELGTIHFPEPRAAAEADHRRAPQLAPVDLLQMLGM